MYKRQILNTTATTGIFTWFGPNSFSASTTGIVIPNAVPNLTGTYSFYNVITGCMSDTATIVMKVKPQPYILSVHEDSLCRPGGQVPVSAKSDSGTINWYTVPSGGVSIGTSISDSIWFTPSITSTTTYYVDATNNGCTTLTRDSVRGRVVICIDSVFQSLCSNVGTYDLFNAKVFPDSAGIWQDTTGLLTSNSIIDLSMLDQNLYLFTYYSVNTTRVYMTVYKYKDPGDPIFFPVTCENQLKLTDGLMPGSYDLGGNWYYEDQLVTDSIITTDVGNNNIMYKFDVNGACPADSTIYIYPVDSLGPEITCAATESHMTLFDVPYYEIQPVDLAKTVTDQPCGVTNVINDYNSDSTLLGQRFEIGQYDITWTALDVRGNESTCTTKLIVYKYIIPNFFSPNGDGYNDTWNFDIALTHPRAIVQVFNRWGQIVWMSNPGYPEKWNGLDSRGRRAADDGYQYVIIEDGKVLTSGSVTLLR